MRDDNPGNPQLKLRVPEELLSRLEKDAKRQKVTMQAVILGIVAAHYQVKVTPPRRGQPKKAEGGK